VKLGSPANLKGQALGGARGRVSISRRAARRAADLAPVIASVQAAGAMSLREIASGLNARGIKTARGGEWSAVQVKRVLERAGA
jgi:hypothetical protein